MGIASFCRRRATAMVLLFTMSVPTAAIGRVRSTRAIRTARSACTSIRAMCTGAATSVASTVARFAQSARSPREAERQSAGRFAGIRPK